MKRSLTNILANKILDNIEGQSLPQLLIRAAMVFISTMAAMAAIYPHAAAEIARAVWSWHDGAVAKFCFIFVLTFNFGKIAQLAIKVAKNAARAEKVATGDIIDGIPVVELLDHLFTQQSFKREEVERKFGIPRNKYTTLAIKLENLGVLVRGENNARVLNEDFARADVAAILNGASTARNLKTVFRQVGPTSYTNQPQKQNILERVRSAITSPAPRFQLHKLENTENA